MKYTALILSLFCTVTLFNSCAQQQVPIDDIINQPIFKEADKQYENVYQSLDGNWKGIFYIYQDTTLSAINAPILAKPTLASIGQLPLKLMDTIVVEQTYTSPTPYFQYVKIRDFYPQKNEYVESEGVNKVQDGKMWCIVHKPNETIIHKGSLESKETIIWQRAIESPLSKEYFRETVLEKTYEIIGWGYYGDADTEKMPPYWFYGKYNRQ